MLLYREEEQWLAHCLEFDLVGQGETQEKAREDLMDGIETLVLDALEHDDLAGLYRPAPVELWRRFAAAPAHGVTINLEVGRRLPPTCIEERSAA